MQGRQKRGIGKRQRVHPNLGTTITLSRPGRKGYESMLSFYLKTQPTIQRTAVYSLSLIYFGEFRLVYPTKERSGGAKGPLPAQAEQAVDV